MGCDRVPYIRFLHLPISIHAPQWGATVPLTYASCICQFQSTHPSGVRRNTNDGYSGDLKFQSTHPSGVRLAHTNENSIRSIISIHAPQWGATSAYHQSPAGALFQSTHPSGVRRNTNDGYSGGLKFQSTHPSGVRLYNITGYSSGNVFQSTHPSGVRPKTPSKKNTTNKISIHAPQWGATEHGQLHSGRNTYFNPRTPVGCDADADNAVRVFVHDFNPRTPVGCDIRFQRDAPQIVISIHAPQWGATWTRSNHCTPR